MRHLITILLLSYSVGVFASPPLTSLSSNSCSSCHLEIFNEWRDSEHANSLISEESLAQQIYQYVKNQDANYAQQCLSCHASHAARQLQTPNYRNPHQEGVNCVLCHTLKSYQPAEEKQGIAAYTYSSTHLQSPSGNSLSPKSPKYHLFPVEPNPDALGDQTQACLGCHHHFENQHGVVLCQTGMEYVAGQMPCQSCHMPNENRPNSTDHRMSGGALANYLEQAIKMTLSRQEENGQSTLQVSLQNTLPHSFPAGVVFRQVHLQLIGYQAEKVVWKSEKTYFQTILADAAGEKTVFPFTATQMVENNRLKPYETKKLNYALPADLTKVEAQLWYRSYPEEILKQFGGEIMLTEREKTALLFKQRELNL